MILDASAFIAYLKNEEKAGAVEFALVTSRITAMSTANLVEVLMYVHRENPQTVDAVLSKLEEFSVELVPPDLATAMIAGRARSRFGINFGDCFCYALAMQREEPILTLDADFAKTDARLVPLP